MIDFCSHLCNENRSKELEDSLEKEDDLKLHLSCDTGETSRRPRFPEEFVGVRHERQRPKGSPGKPVMSLRLVERDDPQSLNLFSVFPVSAYCGVPEQSS